MRLIEFFPESAIAIKRSAQDWQDAVEQCMAPLLKNNYISEQYIQAIKDSTIANGPYYILAPGVAMPHARPECGAIKTGLSLLLLEKEVEWDKNNDPIKLVIGLSAADANSHIDAIQALSELLCEDDALQSLLSAQTEKQLTDILALA